MEIDIERLKELLVYEPETGVFTWTTNTRWKRHIGKVAGTIKKNGYRYLSLDSKGYLSHRLAWFYVYGVKPSYSIDHINGDRSDNRIANLRDVTPLQNSQNRYKANADNKIGVLGVRCTKHGFRSQIRINGKVKFLGNFPNATQAHAAYLDAKRIHHKGNML